MMIATRNAIRGSSSILRRLKATSAVPPRSSVRANFREDEKSELASKASDQQMAVATTPSARHPTTQRQIRRFNDSLAQMQQDVNTLLGHLLGEEAVMMSPFSMLGRGFGGLPMMAPLEERIENTFRSLVDVEVEDTDNAYLITVDVPGFTKGDIKARVSAEGVLTIKGEHKEEEEKEGVKKKSRRFSNFSRSFNLPNDVESEQISASVKDGVLTVTVPKVPKVEAKMKEIPIS